MADGHNPDDARAAALRRVDTREARREAAQIADLITPQGARCSKRQGLHLVGLVARLCDALDQARIELRQRSGYQELYGALVPDYNGLIAVLRDLGIEVFQPSGADAWHWAYGDAGGSAPTVAEACREALGAAGARAPARPTDARGAQ